MRRWTEDEIAQLRELAERGWTASRIARQIGRTVWEVQRKRTALAPPRAAVPFGGIAPFRERARKGACRRWHDAGCRCAEEVN